MPLPSLGGAGHVSVTLRDGRPRTIPYRVVLRACRHGALREVNEGRASVTEKACSHLSNATSAPSRPHAGGPPVTAGPAHYGPALFNKR